MARAGHHGRVGRIGCMRLRAQKGQRGYQAQRSAASGVQYNNMWPPAPGPRIADRRSRIDANHVNAAAAGAAFAAPPGVLGYRHPKAERCVPDEAIDAVDAGVVFHGQLSVRERVLTNITKKTGIVNICKIDKVRQKIEGQNMVIPVSRTARQFAESIKADARIWSHSDYH
ncbi:hypothetical protein D9M73_105450 [compost metagenome]